MTSRTVIKTEVAGSIFKLESQPGDSVAEGDTLLLLESMKMEIPILAPSAGTVSEILVQEGDEVAEDDEIVILTASG